MSLKGISSLCRKAYTSIRKYIVVVDLTKSSSIAALYVVHTHIHTLHTAEAGKVERKCY